MISSSDQCNFDFLILGAGPAGLQLAYFLQKRGLSHLVLERADRVGVFLERFPRHRMFLSINKVHTGYDDRAAQLRYDWNSLLCDDDEMAFTRYTDAYYPDNQDYVRYLRDFADRFELQVRLNTEVTRVERDAGGRFTLTTAGDGQFHARCLVVATGMGLPFIPDVPGIEHAEHYFDFSIDPNEYTNQRVLIIGKGNSAFEMANTLTPVTRVTHLCSPHSIRLAWQSHFFGHLRAVNNEFLDTYILKGQNSALDARIDEIRKEDDEYRVAITFTHAQGQRAVLAYDRVLACTGFRWDHSIFADDCQPERTECGRLPRMTSSWESVNVPGMFFAGTIMQMRDLKKTMSNVLHGFRFNVLSLAGIVGERFGDQPYPRTALPLETETIADHIIERVSSNAGLMHQPGFLGDVIAIDREAQRADYYETLAVDYIRDTRFGEHPEYLVITMEYGHIEGDIFRIDREPDPAKAYNDAYLHPRIRYFQRGEQVGEHHMSETLENDWRVGEHPGQRPLIREMGYIGQDDATQFNQTHRDKLVEYLAAQLDVAVH